ncbi:MAG TPA: phosphatase PAP2 family protein [Candidatus Acidoferrales bacterium]|nr:phosphatase PAP2 family protein [Candidatus Acidoferrales bacterium]
MALPRKSSAFFLLWLLAGVGVIALAWSVDNPMDAALKVDSNSPLHQLAWWCSKLAEGWVSVLAGIFFTIIFILLHRPAVAAKIVFVVLTSMFTGGAALIVRVLAGRTRPHADLPQGFYGVWHAGHWIMGRYEFSAFPSGHSATAAGLAAAAWMVHRGWGTLAALFTLAVMWSRVAVQAHHLSDVVASVVLAIPLAMFSKKVLLPPLEAYFAKLEQARRKR